jgi:hypothetical protein
MCGVEGLLKHHHEEKLPPLPSDLGRLKPNGKHKN